MWLVKLYIGDKLISEHEVTSEAEAIELGERWNMSMIDDGADEDCQPSFGHEELK